VEDASDINVLDESDVATNAVYVAEVGTREGEDVGRD